MSGYLSSAFDLICDKRITSHYRDYIVSEKKMIECCKGSVDTKSERCYILFCCMNTFDEHETFNYWCQVLMTEILILFKISFVVSSYSGKTDLCEASF